MTRPAPVVPLRLYAVALMLGAALLFAIQPVTGRLLLPLVGGAPGGWLTALCFFQLALLAGYALSHGLSRLPAQRHVALILILLLAGSLFLPVRLQGQASAETGAVQVLFWLISALTFPVVALAMLTGGVQRLAALRHPADRVYQLYAASNAGSLLGLLGYPLLMEPLLPLPVQQAVWSCGYLALILLLALLLVPGPVLPSSARPTADHAPLPGWRWAGLAFIPSSLCLGITTLLGDEFGSFPLVWMVPLLLYLLSFILAFSYRPPAALSRLGLLAVLLLVAGMGLLAGGWLAGLVVMPVLLAGFFVMALYFHWRLAADRPAPQRLTVYYLWLALGGALGGLFNALLVPVLFSTPSEYLLVAALGGLCIAGEDRPALSARRLAGLVLAVTLLFMLTAGLSQTSRSYRNFYGIVTVQDLPDRNGQMIRWLLSGEGAQGNQRLTPQPGLEPGLNFPPIRSVMMRPEYRNIGMIGAGAGMALCYRVPGRQFIIYEIDPKIRRIAEDEFTYIRSCGTPGWYMGDGRLLLAGQEMARFDVLIVDAFQGGHIPLHLLTLEALQLYQSRLAPGGVILYNLNSLYYDFFPQVAAQAAATGWQIWRAPHSWVLLAPPQLQLDWLRGTGWAPMVPRSMPLWRDDRVNLLGSLRIFSAP